MGKLSARTRFLLRSFAIMTGLSLVIIGAAALILKVGRPAVLSSGSIAFALDVLSILVFLLLFLSSLKTDPGPKSFSFGKLDAFYAASVAVALVSFLAASRSRENFLQPYILVTAFAVYLLVRANRHRLGGTPAALLAGALAAFAGVEAAHGLAQWAAGREMRGFFFNVNHFAMFLAVALPLAWAASRLGKNAFIRFAGYGVNTLMIAAIGLSRCRTAYTALILVGGVAFLLRRLPRQVPAGYDPRPWRFAVRGGVVLGAAGLVVVSALAVSFKPMSAAGRLLIWKVSLRASLAHPVAGVGYGNFPAVYNAEQGRYFEEGKGTATERLSASADAYAFNDYLESFMETGLIGFIVLLPFWGLVFGAIARVFCRANSPSPGPGPSPDGRLATGAAGSVLAYMVLAGFYYPSRILPLVLLFSGALGWIADNERPASDRVRRSFRGFVLAFAAVSFSAAVILFPTLKKRYAAEQTWSEAIVLARAGRTADALAATRAAYPLLRSDADFADFHAGLLLGAGEAREAAAVLDRARAFSSHPRLAEKLAAAHVELGDLDSALKRARDADAVLPWRLTSKALLADISLRLGDLAGASRYSRMVMDAPMKIRTAEGEALKAEAFGLWTGLRPRVGDEGSPLLDLLAELPAEYRGGVLGALQTMGDRAEAFIQALQAGDPEERACLAFLLANMPDCDVLGLDPALLVENVRLACLARRTIPLAAGVPDDVFLEYVLPYAAADEARDRWRADFYERFREVARESPSVEEAVIRLSRETVLQFRLVYSNKNIREPLIGSRRIIERGLVSCGEASLMLVDACRAVGLPARLAVLPRYRGKPGGHIWVEVWDAGRWRHIVAYDPSLLDKTWISARLASMFPRGGRGLIFAPRFRRTGFRAMSGWNSVFVDISENYLK
jgi:O-antigen ligase/tetratricopeptide (TPR) repeat protein